MHNSLTKPCKMVYKHGWMVYKEAQPSYTNHLSIIMENTVLAVLLLTVAVVTAADGSYQPSAAADGSYQPLAAAAEMARVSNLIGGYSNGLKDKLVCLEKKLKVIKQCETMLTNVKAECNEGNSICFL